MEEEHLFRGSEAITDAIRDAEVERCLRGEKLYGDDFSPAETAAWFRDEEDAYFALSSAGEANHEYGYHALNWRHGFRFLPQRRWRHVLGLGSAYGEELLPLVSRIDRITILESSASFQVPEIGRKPVTYVKPRPDGQMPFSSGSFDLITCLSVLHHIPNVSASIREISRCLVSEGFVLLREPITSMGDWRKPRRGLTKRERGIPLPIFRRTISESGLRIVRETPCCFSLTSRLGYFMRNQVYNSSFCTAIDAAICRLPFWPRAYHAGSIIQKLRPIGVFFLAQKP